MSRRSLWAAKGVAYALLVGVATLGSATAHAQTSSSLLADIRAVCTQPAAAGDRWSVSASGTGNVQIAQKTAGATGRYTLKREAWSGVQRVLKNQQSASDADYRACVRDVAVIFRQSIPVATRSQVDIERRLKAFLASRNLTIPGGQWAYEDLEKQFGLSPLASRETIGTKILSGDFLSFYNFVHNELGTYDRYFLMRDHQLVGVMIRSECPRNVANVCADLYRDVRASLVDAEGPLSVTKTQATTPPFNGAAVRKVVITDAVASDDKWRVLLTRVDVEGDAGPTFINLVVAAN